MKLVKRLSPMSIREVCCDNHYFNTGLVAEYEAVLFKFERTDITTEHLVMLAETIKDNSDTEDDVFTICNKLAVKIQCFIVTD